MHTATPLPVPRKRTPWNKGRLIGQKRPLKPKDVWATRVRLQLQLQGRKRDLALFNLAIDSKLRGCDLVRLQVDNVCAGGRVRDRGTVIQQKQGDRSSSKSWSRPGPRSMIGCRRWNSGTGATCSRAVSEPNRISLLGNTLASSMPGSRVRGSTVRPTAHIQCAERRRRRSTERPVTFERFSFCSGIRSSKALSDISGSRSMTLSASQSRSNSDLTDLRGPATWRGRSYPGDYARSCPISVIEGATRREGDRTQTLCGPPSITRRAGWMAASGTL
jgi:hypothetical protein